MDKVFNQKNNSKFVLDKPIVIVGIMGVGKTSVGKVLARDLSVKFLDTDSLIEKYAGISIKDIFLNYGELKFREFEEDVILRELNDLTPRVISTGEGGFLYDSVRELVKSKCYSVWLKGDLSVLAERTARRNTRPLLDGKNNFEVLKHLSEDRADLYKLADFIIDIDGAVVRENVEKILKKLHS